MQQLLIHPCTDSPSPQPGALTTPILVSVTAIVILTYFTVSRFSTRGPEQNTRISSALLPVCTLATGILAILITLWELQSTYLNAAFIVFMVFMLLCVGAMFWEQRTDRRLAVGVKKNNERIVLLNALLGVSSTPDDEDRELARQLSANFGRILFLERRRGSLDERRKKLNSATPSDELELEKKSIDEELQSIDSELSLLESRDVNLRHALRRIARRGRQRRGTTPSSRVRT